MRRLVLILAVVCLAAPARAMAPGEELADPALEARARALSLELRCVVCDNESIDASGAPIARDLRRIVRERIAAGDSDAAVKAMLVERYGTYILLRPPVSPLTWALWFGPFALGGLAVIVLLSRRGKKTSPAPEPALSADEEREADALIARYGPTTRDET